MTRRAHYIRRNRRAATPRRCVFFDCETVEERRGDLTLHSAFLIAAIYATRSRRGDLVERERWIFRRRRDFLLWLSGKLRRREALYVFAHRAEFDVMASGLAEFLLRDLDARSLPASGQGRFFWRARTRQGTVVLIDTMNFFDVSLAELGRMLGLPKLRMPGPEASAAEWEAYAMRDAEIILRAISRLILMIRQENLGNFAPTIASLAFNIFRHRFMPERSIMVHKRPGVTALERKAYFGGRAEAWRWGHVEGIVYYLDVNSMYASIMRDLAVPVRLIGIYRDASVQDLQRWLKRYAVIAEVEIQVREPVAPLRTEEGVIFPVGTFRTVLCGPELELVLRKGRIRSVGRVALYQRAVVFREFIEYCWARRHEALQVDDEVMARFWKRVANALYGKFGQYSYEQKCVPATTCTDEIVVDRYVIADTHERGTLIHIGDRLLWTRRSGLAPDGMVAISAYIASAARVRLWEIAERAGLENVLYMDTDAVMVNQAGRDRLEAWIGDGLGKLKEKWISNGVTIYSSKHYITDLARTWAGIPRSAIWLEDGKVVFKSMIHWQVAMARGITAATAFRDGVKRVHPAVRGRTPTSDGRTLPVRVGDAPASPARSPRAEHAPSQSRRPSR